MFDNVLLLHFHLGRAWVHVDATEHILHHSIVRMRQEDAVHQRHTLVFRNHAHQCHELLTSHLQLDTLFRALNNFKHDLAHAEQLHDSLADTLEGVTKVCVEMPNRTLCLPFSRQDLCSGLLRSLASHDALGIHASNCRQQLKVGTDDTSDVIELDTVIYTCRRIVFNLVVWRPTVVKQKRIDILIEIAVTVCIAFDSFGFSNEGRFRSLCKPFTKLGKGIVDQFLDRRTLAD